ncbi:hypothetical protein [Actinoplanes utahensis]|uniref:Uncharacterized protein n=1 Tax=Actinoplanes utahensis TaxID=1869 RepID=A0A0A6UMX3_ACTUT|nr:hypothetical protein [Actinoplanes utahensis]KHD76761.1 hypothetical protein MB27_15880 [Actinoplanes utahensis]GIF33170.1 hypothetical protein Aut01nite_61560 [Actinoplanes utahensis]
MTREIEDVIRAAQSRRAEQAPSAERIRAGLPRRAAKVRNQRRYGLAGAVVAAAAVTAAAVVPSLALGDRTPPAVVQPAGPAGSPSGPAKSAAPATSAAPQRSLEVALGFRPHWVPSGFREHLRHVMLGADDGADPTLLRVWKTGVPDAADPTKGGGLSLSVSTGVEDPANIQDTSGERVDINGAPGFLSGARDGKSSVSWSPGEGTVLSIDASRVRISESDLLKMARSVRPDTGVATNPVRLTWLPDGWVSQAALVGGRSAAGWHSEILAGTPMTGVSSDVQGKEAKEGKVSTGGDVNITVGTTSLAPAGGTILTVNGWRARNPVRTDLPGQSLTYLVVELGGGRLMTLVSQGTTLDGLKRIAEGAEIEPSGLEWIGR